MLLYFWGNEVFIEVFYRVSFRGFAHYARYVRACAFSVRWM